ncbi:MAG: sensor histidine kinase [Desulfitobacterium sp.]
MSESKLLFSLLLNLSSKIEEIGTERARLELPKLICTLLETDGCALYFSKSDREGLFLANQYSIPQGQVFADTWPENWSPISDSAEYLNNHEMAKGFAEDNSFKMCLILPLHIEGKIAGVVLMGWKSSSSLEELSPKDLQLLQSISMLLSHVYCVYPLINKLRQRETNLATLYRKAEDDLETSRKKVSLELHDEVGQVLTSILLQLKLLQQSDDLEYMKGRLGGLHHITLETLDEVRRISQNLRPNLLEKLGLQAAVEAHIKEYRENTGIEVELRTHNLSERIAENIETITYRAVQEGLTNVARHSGANRVIINLTIKGNNLFLQITDNGKGFKKNDVHGTGLLGMRERSTRVGGKFWLVNKVDQGLTINMLLPLV